MPQTLLIVDDDTDMRELLRHILALRGYQIIIAASAREALVAAANHSLTAALIDINMPAMNGIELCQILQAQDRERGNPATPVWIVTGAYRRGQRDAARAAGAVMVLRKPLKAAELCKRFERALKLHAEKTRGRELATAL